MSENVNDVRIWKSRKKMEKVNNCKKCQNQKVKIKSLSLYIYIL